jgi:hypothetical protein
MPERYLGDGVYVTFDGYNVTLDLRAQGGAEIVLDPGVMRVLMEFNELCRHHPAEDVVLEGS